MKDSEKSKEQLVEKVELLQALIDCLPDQIYVKDTKGRFVLCNRASAEITQFENPAELIGKTDFDTCKPEDAPKFYEEEQQIIKTGVPLVNHELVTVNRAGQAFWSLITKLPWRDKDGKTIGIIGSNRDITDLKKAELALKESEARYKAIFESTNEGVLITDIEKKHLMYFNPAFCRMFGYNEQELGKMTVYDLHPKEHSQNIDTHFSTQKRDGKISAANIPCIRKDGTVFFANLNTATVTIGQRQCSVGFFTDVTERKLNEEALRESEIRYKTIFETAREGILIVDIENRRFRYANPAVCRMFGYTAEEMTRLTVSDIHPKEHLEWILADFEANMRGEKTTSHNIPCLRKDRTIFYADINSASVVIDQERCDVGCFIDVTQHRRDEEALRHSEARYKVIFNSAKEGILVADIETRRFKYANPAICSMFGYTVEQWQQLSVPDIHPKKVVPRVTAEFDAQARGEKALTTDIPCLRRDGTIFYADINTTNVIIDDRPCNVGLFVDITERKNAEKKLREAHDELEARVLRRTTDLAQAVEKLQQEIAERKRAEESLRKAEQRFRTIFENTVVGLYRTTPDGKILLANPALVKMFGCKSFEQLSKMNLEKEGFDQSTPRSKFKKLIENRGSVVGLESVWIKPDGSKLFVSESASAVRDEQGNVLYYEGTVLDVTKRKEAEEKLLLYQQHLRSLASQLSLAEERLRRRIATELHDHISQNLAISKMKLDSLIDSAGSKQAKSLREVADTLAQTIETTRTLTFEVSPPVLYELGFIAAVGWLTKQTKRRFGLDVEFADDGKSKKLDTDVRVLLFQAVRELLVNIVKHAGASKAYVTTKRVKDSIRIIVEDDGIGFDASGISTSDYTKGGFGLFNIRERIDQIGGKFELHSGPGSGTKITLTAPLLKTAKKRTPRKPPLKRS